MLPACRTADEGFAIPTFEVVPSDVEGFMEELWEFQSAFHDCFARSEPRAHFFDYMVGQFSKLERKSIEPMALEVEGGTIRIRTFRKDSRLHLMVEDDGVGISEATLPTVLDQGIGVSNVNEWLKVLFGHDYRMWIDSQPGEGMRIQIEMPELQTAGLAAVS